MTRHSCVGLSSYRHGWKVLELQKNPERVRGSSRPTALREPPYLRCLEYLPRMCPEPVHPGVGQLEGEKQRWSQGEGPARPRPFPGSRRLSPNSASQNGCLKFTKN